MLRSLREILGYSIKATDGVMGTADDFLFDQNTWEIRYMVDDTGKWLPGRRVLLYADALGHPVWESKAVPVDLSQNTIENSPHIDTHAPVSRQKEAELFSYYNWDPYWAMTAPEALPPYIIPPKMPGGDHPPSHQEESHLRSVDEILGYTVFSQEDEAGKIDDLIVEEEDWLIRFLVVDRAGLLRSETVMMPTSWVHSIDWAMKAIQLHTTEQEIQQCPEFDPAQPVNSAVETRYYDYFGRPVYWAREKEMAESQSSA